VREFNLPRRLRPSGGLWTNRRWSRPIPTTVSAATALNPTSDASEGSDGTTARKTATGASKTSETARESEAADDPANFGDLEVADAAMYTAQGSGSRAGT